LAKVTVGERREVFEQGKLQDFCKRAAGYDEPPLVDTKRISTTLWEQVPDAIMHVVSARSCDCS